MENLVDHTAATPWFDLRRLYVPSGRDAAFETALKDLLQRGPDGELIAQPKHFTATCETRGLMVVAKTGSGKTTLIRHVLSNLDILQTVSPDIQPWISVEVPSNVTMKSLGIEVLDKLGYRIENQRSISEHEIWRIVRHRFRLKGTVLLWIDEAQDLFRTKGPATTRHILNTIKNLM